MFQQLKNIDTAFRYVRWCSFGLMVVCLALSLYSLHLGYSTIKNNTNKVYVLVGDKLLPATQTDRTENLTIEIKDHVKNFHNLFYGLEPDEQYNQHNLSKALYLADGTAKKEYDNLMEQGYYSSIISGNISQRVLEPDSIQVDITREPYLFRYYTKLRIIRPTSTVLRSLVTQGQVRTSRISDNNPHGLLIERWEILANQDLTIEKR